MKKESFDEKVGWGRMLLVGFQHVLTMCPGTIAVPLILAGALGLNEKETAFLVSANFFTSGIAILIQVLGIAGRIQIPDCSGVVLCTLKSHDPDR